jgi:serine/threonine-protein kinase RsbW
LVSFHLALPRDEASVPITRRLIAQSLEVVGVEPDTISDVEIALSEACANVLRHAQDGDVYEVLAGFDESCAFLEVIDQGEGFDPDSVAPTGDAEAETGRGVTLMRALMDEVHFQRRTTTDGTPGSSVILEKHLRWRDDAAVEHLKAGATFSADQPVAERGVPDPA